LAFSPLRTFSFAGSGRHLDGRHPLVRDALHPAPGDLEEAGLDGQLERQRDPLPRGERTGEDGHPRVVLHVFEEERRAAALLVQLGDVTELEVPVHPTA